MNCRVVQIRVPATRGPTIHFGDLWDDGTIFWLRHYDISQEGAYKMIHRVLEKGLYWLPQNSHLAGQIIIVPSPRDIRKDWLDRWVRRNEEKYGRLELINDLESYRSEFAKDYALEFLDSLDAYEK